MPVYKLWKDITHTNKIKKYVYVNYCVKRARLGYTIKKDNVAMKTAHTHCEIMRCLCVMPFGVKYDCNNEGLTLHTALTSCVLTLLYELCYKM